METKQFTGDEIDQASALICKGELIAFPTETVYGLGANALDEHAVKQVYAVKGRPSDNPLIVHVSDFEMVKQYVTDFPSNTKALVDSFWPGPLTLIFIVKPNTFSSTVTGGLKTVAFRMPKNDKTLALINKAGVPLVGPSANTSGKPSPTTAQHVFHDLHGKIAGILDDGATQIGVESTVLDLTAADGVPVILRPGAITKESLEEVIGKVRVDQHLISEKEAPKAPGMKYKHYSPDTPVWIVDGNPDVFKKAITWAKNKNQRIGLFADDQLISAFSDEIDEGFSFGEDSVEQATKLLFAGLRSLDEKNIDIIFAQAFPETGLGIAYMNRLKKAANQKNLKSDSIFE
ncbi:L-threonylcarbamoyladenylate synthase [Enterococcus caccae]|uniref:Threonylcarbamoyl-AMP synthase n=1 Tax=Enterococcus caccae ATCC BAA-1240 TaxID=1158612 RepID=R3WNV4_9ENTE|nr:L-threonylcarbamoyladenylate synthase [Enterococcus caccae]EOL43490.1 Sua5/YciO/YrdC/YwlC family protein [Enterococcus caccae ATCC BAA-1240]EOT68110.1 Sua5/YciO/YrdC/YwlC family protein [Enterococcus caccae ATCC BAA-1240]OJG27027.1 Sua5/YciO/YrdC/YwlC family protein [Enterococcus caccae]